MQGGVHGRPTCIGNSRRLGITTTRHPGPSSFSFLFFTLHPFLVTYCAFKRFPQPDSVHKVEDTLTSHSPPSVRVGPSGPSKRNELSAHRVIESLPPGLVLHLKRSSCDAV